MSASWIRKNGDGGEGQNDLAGVFCNISISDNQTRGDAGTLDFDKDAREEIALPFRGSETYQDKRIKSAIADCVRGDWVAIKNYLKESTEAHLFLHGTDGYGNTSLILATSESHPSMVSLLLEHGAKVNAANKDGRIALMEAALWGCRESVEILLKAGAHKNMRDCAGRRATDFARDTHINREERFQRAGWVKVDFKSVREARMIREERFQRAGRFSAEGDCPERDNPDRHHIAILLEEQSVTQPSLVFTDNERGKYAFKKCSDSRTITLCGPIKEHHESRIQRTAAFLMRGAIFPHIHATSGWGSDALPQNTRSGPTWIDLVYELAEVIGHELPADNRDQGRSGQYFACHAEKKLMAYLIEKHYFWEWDTELDPELEKLIEEQENTVISLRQLPGCSKVLQLERKKKELEIELLDTRDVLLGWNVNRDSQEVQRLKRDISNINEKLALYEADSEMTTMRAQEKELKLLREKRKNHQRLISLSEHERYPKQPLRRAVIITSNPVCKDCEAFKDKAEQCFDVEIELHCQSLDSAETGKC